MNSNKKSSQYLLDLENQTKKLLQQVGLESPPVSSDENESDSDSRTSDSYDDSEFNDSKKKPNINSCKDTRSDSEKTAKPIKKQNAAQDLNKIIIEMEKTVSSISINKIRFNSILTVYISTEDKEARTKNKGIRRR
jgi:hypothetical protein